MAASAAQIARLRRMVADDAYDYGDADLAAYIEAYPLLDASGYEPYPRLADGRPSATLNTLWTPTYDLAAAAADVWAEKAAASAGDFDTSADGQSVALSQAHAHAKAMQRYYAARRRVAAVRLRPEPLPGCGLTDPEFPAPEGDE